MKKALTKNLACLIGVFLLSSSTVSPYVVEYSYALGYNAAGHILCSGSKSSNVMSTSNQIMGKVTLYYDLIYTGIPPYVNVHRPTYRYYSLNYRIDLQPMNSVKYKNGLGGWFEGTGDATVKEAYISTTLKESSHLVDDTDFKNVAFNHGKTRAVGGKEYDLRHPIANDTDSIYGDSITSGKWYYGEKGVDDGKGLKISHGPNYRVKIETYQYDTNTAKNTTTAAMRVSFPNRPVRLGNNGYVSFFGSHEFHSDAETIDIEVRHSGKFVLAEGNFWGSCEKESDANSFFRVIASRPEDY